MPEELPPGMSPEIWKTLSPELQEKLRQLEADRPRLLGEAMRASPDFADWVKRQHKGPRHSDGAPPDEYDEFFKQTDLVPPGPLGLLPCLMVHIDTDPEGWSCHVCRRHQPAGSYQVWVSLDVKVGDSPESVTEACGPESAQAAWCLHCARKLGGA